MVSEPTPGSKARSSWISKAQPVYFTSRNIWWNGQALKIKVLIDSFISAKWDFYHPQMKLLKPPHMNLKGFWMKKVKVVLVSDIGFWLNLITICCDFVAFESFVRFWVEFVLNFANQILNSSKLIYENPTLEKCLQ